MQPDGIPSPVSSGRELKGRCQNMFSINVTAESTSGLKYSIQTIPALLPEPVPTGGILSP